MPLLGEDSDWEIVLQWDGDRLGASGLNVAVGEDPSEFLDAGCVLSSFDHLVNPFGWGARVGRSLAYPVPCLWAVVEDSWVPRNVGNYDFFVLPVGRVVVQFEGR